MRFLVIDSGLKSISISGARSSGLATADHMVRSVVRSSEVNLMLIFDVTGDDVSLRYFGVRDYKAIVLKVLNGSALGCHDC